MNRCLQITIETLPEDHWDLLMVLVDVIEDSIRNPGCDLDDVYKHLRRHFVRDTGMHDIVPDFVQDCEDLIALTRYLKRMELAVDDEASHVRDAFEPLHEYMECVFRPRKTEYTPNFWPRKPKETTFAPLPPFNLQSPDPGPAEQEPPEPSPLSMQAQKVLYLAPIALEGLERLLRDDPQRSRNGPVQPLLWEEVDALHRLHRELGVLLREARHGRPLQAQLEIVRTMVAATFKLATDTGELMIAGAPPLAASALPAFGSLKACEALLHMDPTSSATIAAGVIAGTFALKPKRPRAKKSRIST